MSISEILVIVLIAIFCLRKEELEKIISVIKNIRSSLNATKNQILSKVNDLSQDSKIMTENEFEEINYYLQKIIEIEGKYEREYNLGSIKSYYLDLIKSKTKDAIDSKGQDIV